LALRALNSNRTFLPILCHLNFKKQKFIQARALASSRKGGNVNEDLWSTLKSVDKAKSTIIILLCKLSVYSHLFT